MKANDFQNKMNDIQSKLGEENSSLILDNIAELLTDNQNMNTVIDDKDKEINRLKAMNETLQKVNGNLLQQVSMAEDPDTKPNEEDSKPKDFDFNSVFDENGNFKR